MRAPAVALLALALLSGCSGGDDGGDGSTGGASTTGGATESASTTTAAPALQHRLVLSVQLPGQQAEVGVPFPHGAWCLPPAEWTLEGGSARNATAETQEVDRGRVLWVRGEGNARFNASIDLAGRSPCQTLRHDPWSIDPDDAEGRPEVFASAVAEVMVEVVEVQGACRGGTLWRGEAGPGWTPLPQAGSLAGSACA